MREASEEYAATAGDATAADRAVPRDYWDEEVAGGEEEEEVEEVARAVKKLGERVGKEARQVKAGREDMEDEVEMMLEASCADFKEIEVEIKMFQDKIEDTDQFINSHLDSVRESQNPISRYCPCVLRV